MNRKIFGIGVICFVADQISKAIISSLVGYEESIVVIKNFFSLTYVNNTGAAFSILQNKTLLLVSLGIVCLLLLIKMMKETKQTKFTNISYGLLVGGVLGNLSDRVFLGSVRDFLDFNIFGYNFPVFNIADVFIVIGVVFLIIICFIDAGNHGSSSSKSRRSNQN